MSKCVVPIHHWYLEGVNDDELFWRQKPESCRYWLAIISSYCTDWFWLLSQEKSREICVERKCVSCLSLFAPRLMGVGVSSGEHRASLWASSLVLQTVWPSRDRLKQQACLLPSHSCKTHMNESTETLKESTQKQTASTWTGERAPQLHYITHCDVTVRPLSSLFTLLCHHIWTFYNVWRCGRPCICLHDFQSCAHKHQKY